MEKGWFNSKSVARNKRSKARIEHTQAGFDKLKAHGVEYMKLTATKKLEFVL